MTTGTIVRRFGGLAMLAGTLAVAGCRSSSTSGMQGASAVKPAPDLSYLPAEVAARKIAKQPYTTPPAVKKHLYPPPEQAASDLAAALKQARAEHKNVILDFGGSWCGDCQVLDIYFRQPPNDELLGKNFVKVNINIGDADSEKDQNLDIAHRYGVPVTGVPALAVLDSNGRVLYAQKKEFSDMRYMEPSYVTGFLNQWKPKG